MKIFVTAILYAAAYQSVTSIVKGHLAKTNQSIVGPPECGQARVVELVVTECKAPGLYLRILASPPSHFSLLPSWSFSFAVTASVSLVTLCFFSPETYNASRVSRPFLSCLGPSHLLLIYFPHHYFSFPFTQLLSLQPQAPNLPFLSPPYSAPPPVAFHLDLLLPPFPITSPPT